MALPKSKSSAVFADTGWWIALVDPTDALHPVAKQIGPAYAHRPLITSERVLTELLNHFSGGGDKFRRIAAQLVAEIRVGGEVVEQTGRLFDAALTLYAGRLDKSWSLTDCSSMAIMTRYGITEVLSHDHHSCRRVTWPCSAPEFRPSFWARSAPRPLGRASG